MRIPAARSVHNSGLCAVARLRGEAYNVDQASAWMVCLSIVLPRKISRPYGCIHFLLVSIPLKSFECLVVRSDIELERQRRVRRDRSRREYFSDQIRKPKCDRQAVGVF